MIKKIKNKINLKLSKLSNKPLVAKSIKFIKKVTLPGFNRIPIYQVAIFFIKGLKKSSLSLRASSVSYNILLSIFPAIVFFFTIIPYIPLEGFQQKLMLFLEDIIPPSIFVVIENILLDIIMRPRGGLLSLGFILALFFATNGVNSLIIAFNKSHYVEENRTMLKQRVTSLMLVFIISTLLIVSIVLLSIGPRFISLVLNFDFIDKDFVYFVINAVKWIVVLALLFFAYSFLYYYAPAKTTRYKFITPGATLATVLIIVATMLFNFYLNNFARYNTLYGSIGTLIIIMIWINFNVTIVLIGYELNMSIKTAGDELDMKNIEKVE